MKNSRKTRLAEGRKIVVAKSIEEIENIRSVWEEMQNNETYPIINADIDRYISVIKAINGEVQPYVMLFKRNDCLEMMVIARIEKRRLKLKVGYKTLFSPTLRCLTVEHGGIIGEATNEVCAVLIRELMNILSRYEADIVQFEHLRTDSPVYKLAREMPGILTRGYFPKIQQHWMMSVPDNIELFYKSCSHTTRRQLRRYVRAIEKTYPGQVKVITYRREDELDDAIKAASTLSAQTYQYTLGAGLVDDFRTRTLLSTAAKLGWLRASVLFVNDSPCAFQFGLQYRQTHFMDQMGFDPKWKNFRVGTVLFVKTMEKICNDPTVDTIDFYVGDAEYKRRYCNRQIKRASINIFAPRLYPVFINMLQTAMMGLNLGLEYILNKTGYVSWVKRHWRNLLQTRRPESGS